MSGREAAELWTPDKQGLVDLGVVWCNQIQMAGLCPLLSLGHTKITNKTTTVILHPTTNNTVTPQTPLNNRNKESLSHRAGLPPLTNHPSRILFK